MTVLILEKFKARVAVPLFGNSHGTPYATTERVTL